ncbi:tRNA lysidine(34) synthetase TilS [bacterium]|nr:tRNA lysidine(34) synthetase TilS [bacterium]
MKPINSSPLPDRGFVPKFLHYWRRAISPRIGDTARVGVAVSAGRDSSALAAALGRFGPALGIQRLVLLHLDHGIRPPAERAEDIRALKALARRVRAPLVVARARIKRRGGTEAAGRAARLEFFRKAVRRHKLSCVATAHHLDDRIETFFLFLFRGSGSRGLSSLRAAESIRLSRSRSSPLLLVRPFLPFTRDQVRRYAESECVRFHEDSTNLDRRYLRNRIRLDLIPLLEEIHPAFRPAIAAGIEALEEEDAALSALASSALDALTGGKARSENGFLRSLSLDRARLKRWPPGILARILLRADRLMGGPGLLGGHTSLRAAARAIAGPGTSVFSLPAGRRLHIDKELVKFQSR